MTWSLARTAILAALCVVGCRSSYPAPAPSTWTATQAPDTRDENRGDLSAIHAMERRCRTRLERDTADASLSALDRVHEVLGSSCDVSTVDRDPLHWVLHCRSDALFASGQYELADKSVVACRELGGARVSPWQCVGAVFHALFAGGAAIEGLGAAVIGHVDMQPLNAGSQSNVCTALMQALDYTPSVPWEPVAAGANDEARQHANEQLAFCRAASVGDELRKGVTKKGPLNAQVELAVVGAGSSWLRSRQDGVCPAHGKSWQERSDCLDARRVDLLVRFTPKAERTHSSCNADRNDPAGALYCLEQCVEEAAVGSKTGSGLTTTNVPLFTPSRAGRVATPAGFYLHQLGAGTDRALDLPLVCDALGIGGRTCGAAPTTQDAQ